MFKKLVLAIAIVSTTAVCAYAAKPKVDKKVARFDKEAAAIVADKDVVGANVIVIKNNEIAYNKAFGVASKKTEVPMSSSVYVKVGAVSRIFSAIATLQLVEQGKIDINAPAETYLGYPVYNPSYPDIPITVKMFLLQTSTLGAKANLKPISNINPENASEDNKVFLSSTKPTGKPGVRHNSTGQNAQVLAAIVEKVSGMTYQAYLQENVFGPLGFRAGFDLSSLEEDPTTLSGYVWSAEKNRYKSFSPYKPVDYTNYVLGETTASAGVGGGLIITSDDLAKVIMAILNNGVYPVTGTRILQESSVALMLLPQAKKKTVAMQIGLNNKDIEDYPVYYTTGVVSGVNAMVAFQPKDGIAVIAVAGGGHDKDLDSDGQAKNSFNQEVRTAFVNNFAN